MASRKRATPLWAILLVCGCTILLSAGQLLMKVAAGTPFPEIIWNPVTIASIALYGLGAVLMVIALKHGELSVLYPIVSLGFVWVMLASVLILGEQVTPARVAGTAAIIAGISVIGHQGSRRRRN